METKLGPRKMQGPELESWKARRQRKLNMPKTDFVILNVNTVIQL